MSLSSPEEATAAATIVLAVATSFLFVATSVLAYAAFRQLPLLTGQLLALSRQISAAAAAEAAAEARYRERKADERQRQLEVETLHICTKYDTDPVLNDAARRLWAATNEGTDYKSSTVDKLDVILLANFLDGVAVGVLQGLYSNEIVRDHMGPFFEKYYKQVLPQVFGGFEDYEALKSLCESWQFHLPQVNYFSKKS